MANTPQESTLGPWRISLIAGAIQLQHGSTAFWIEADTEIELSDGPVLRASKKILQGTTLTLDFADGLSVTHRFGQAEDWLRVTTTLHNRTTRALPLRQVRILAGKLEAGPANRIFSQSETMTGITGIFQLAGSFLSDSCLGLTDAAGAAGSVAAVLMGWLWDCFHSVGISFSIPLTGFVVTAIYGFLYPGLLENSERASKPAVGSLSSADSRGGDSR